MVQSLMKDVPLESWIPPHLVHYMEPSLVLMYARPPLWGCLFGSSKARVGVVELDLALVRLVVSVVNRGTVFDLGVQVIDLLVCAVD